MNPTVTPDDDPGQRPPAHAEPAVPVVYGLLAEFETGDAMSAAARKANAAGYTRFDCYSPYPVGDAADAMNFPKSEMGPVMFIGGLTGACSGFLMQYWCNAWGYSLNVGGRPYFSWPSFIPITFEMMVLTTALTGLFGLIATLRVAALQPPAVQLEGIRSGQPRSILPVHRGDRPEVRRGRDPRLPRMNCTPCRSRRCWNDSPDARSKRCGLSCVALAIRLTVTLGSLSGCRQKMADQPYYRPYEQTEFI